MKNLIITIGVLMLLLTFPLQYAVEQRNHHNIAQLEKYVHNAKEKAKQAGYFTHDIKQELIDNITNEFEIEASEVIINVTETPKYRVNTFDERELIHYHIEVPIKGIIAAAAFYGIDETDNQKMYVIDQYTTSELVKP